MSEQPSRRGGSGVGPAARRGAVGAPVEGRGAAGPAGRAAAAAPNAARRVLGGLRWPDHRIQQVQRRTLTTLVAAQALGGLGITIGIAVAAILAEEILGSPDLAGLA